MRDTVPPPPPPRYGHFHVGLTIHDWGISVGNAARVTGIRVNVRDAGLRRVNGINHTLWKPREPASGTVNGIQAGVLPGSQTVNGLAVGLAGVVTEQRARWVTLGGLGAVSNGGLRGLGVSGFATVANGSVTGVGIGGFAVVTSGRLTGLGIAGLAVVADKEIRGVSIAGYRVDSRRVAALTVAGPYLKTNECDRLSVSAYNRVRGLQRGLTIGLYNSAFELRGVQVGLLNRAKNNKPPFRILPILNVHL